MVIDLVRVMFIPLNLYVLYYVMMNFVLGCF
jgi:hypothetical protein